MQGHGQQKVQTSSPRLRGRIPVVDLESLRTPQRGRVQFRFVLQTALVVVRLLHQLYHRLANGLEARRSHALPFQAGRTGLAVRMRSSQPSGQGRQDCQQSAICCSLQSETQSPTSTSSFTDPSTSGRQAGPPHGRRDDISDCRGKGKHRFGLDPEGCSRAVDRRRRRVAQIKIP